MAKEPAANRLTKAMASAREQAGDDRGPMEPVTLHLPRDARHQLKVTAARLETTVSALVTELTVGLLDSAEEQQQAVAAASKRWVRTKRAR